jgi:hypothetical protein
MSLGREASKFFKDYSWMLIGASMLQTGCGFPAPASSTNISEYTPLSPSARRQTPMATISDSTFPDWQNFQLSIYTNLGKHH